MIEGVLIEIGIEIIGGIFAGVGYYFTCYIHKKLLRKKK